MSGLDVHREIAVPDTGNEDFARTVDVFHNPTGSTINTTVSLLAISVPMPTLQSWPRPTAT